MKLKPTIIIGIVLGFAVFTCESSIAATFQWDGDTGIAAAQDGSGTWNSANTNWINAGSNVSWADTNNAAFGAGVDGTYAVTVALDPTAGSLIFNNSGYTLSAVAPQTITATTSSSTIGATALVVVTGKTVTIGSNVTVATPAIAQNSYLSGGGTLIIESGGTLKEVGAVNTNILYLNAAAVEVKTGGSIVTTDLGSSNGSVLFVNGDFTVNGGTVTSYGTMGLGQTNGGTEGTLTLNSGNVTATSTNGLRVGSGNASPTTPGGTVNLNGGTLTAYKVWKGSSGVGKSILNLNGSRVRATANVADFMKNFSRANVRNGGAIIDLGAFNCTILQDLNHSNISGDAATDGGFQKYGTGTLSLAAAVANDYNGGTLVHEGALGFDTAAAAPVSGKIKIESAACLKIYSPGAFTTFTSALSSGLLDTASTGALALVANSSENIDFTGYPDLMLGARANSTYSGLITAASGNYHLGGSGGVASVSLKLNAANALTGANNLVAGAAGFSGATCNVIITNSNKFSGTTTVKGGILTLGDDTADGFLPNTSGIVVEAGATMDFHAFGTVAAPAAISGAGNLQKSGNGTLTLASANSYSGATQMVAGILLASDPGAFGTSTIAATAGQLQLSGGITVTNVLRCNGSGLGGSDGVINTVSGDNTVTNFGFYATTGTRLKVTSGSSLAIPNDFANGNASSLRVLGSGTLILGGANSGGMNAGKLFILGDGNTAGPTVKAGNDAAFGGATITFVASSPSTLQSADAVARTFTNAVEFKDATTTFGTASTGDLTFAGGAVLLSSDVGLKINNSRTTFTGTVSESGSRSLAKSGPGILELAGSTAISGAMTVSEGTLLVNAGVSAGAGVVVSDNAILGGSGTITGNIDVSSLGTLAPGDSTGTLTAQGAVYLNGSLEIEINGAAADRLAVSGDLDISSATLNLTSLGSGFTQSPYVIASFGSLIGTEFAHVNGLPPGYAVEYDLTNKVIRLVSSASSGFATWINTNYPSLSDKTAVGDPDSDGKSNLLEYAFATNPSVSTGGSIKYVAGGAVTTPGQPVAVNTAVGGGVNFLAVFGRRKDYMAASLTYTVQFSAGLDEWVNSATIPTLVTAADSAGEIDAVSVPFPTSITTSNGDRTPTFFRVRVSETP